MLLYVHYNIQTQQLLTGVLSADCKFLDASQLMYVLCSRETTVEVVSPLQLVVGPP